MYLYVQSCCLRPCQVLENSALWTDVHHQIGWGHFQFFYVYFGTLQESSSCIQSMAQILVSWEGTPSRNILRKQRPYLWCGGNGELPQSRSSYLAVLLYRTRGRELLLFRIGIDLMRVSRGRLLEERSGKGESACSCHTGNVLKTRFLPVFGHKLDSNNKLDLRYITNAHAICLKAIFVVYFWI